MTERSNTKKRICSILAVKSKVTKKIKAKRRSNIISSWKTKVRKEQRQNTTKQQEREQSDYLFVENKHRVSSQAPRARKLKIHAPIQLVIQPAVVQQPQIIQSRFQLVDQSTRGSRADIQDLKEKIRTVSNRVHHAMNKIKTLLKTHNIPSDEGQLKALLNAQQDLASLPQQIDRAVSASSTLALVEGRHWRSVPNSLVHGLVIDNITAEREIELATRLARTPLKSTRATVDEEAIKQIDAFSEALAAEIKATMDKNTSLETLEHAHNMMCKFYEEGIIKTTNPDSIQRTAMFQKLLGTRSLMKNIFRLRKANLSNQRGKPEDDPANDLVAIPAPSSNLEQQALAEKP
jgi:hypothetical protein